MLIKRWYVQYKLNEKVICTMVVADTEKEAEKLVYGKLTPAEQKKVTEIYFYSQEVEINETLKSVLDVMLSRIQKV